MYSAVIGKHNLKERKIMLKRMLAVLRRKGQIAVALTVLLNSIMPFSAMADDAISDYAGASFGAVTKYVNMHEDYANYMSPVYVDGKEGLKSADVAGSSMWIGINDKFMYDLPNDTPVDITVEYFDEGYGHFSIHYDSYNPATEWPGVPDNDVYKETEVVFCENTKVWKSHTFHIEDLRAANRIYNGDIRLTTYSPFQGQSTEDVTFGSLKITYGEYANPLKYAISTGVVGNLLNENDETAFNITACNKDSEQPISFKINGTVYDEYGNEMSRLDELSYELAPHGSSECKVPFKNPQKYGLYRLKGNFEVEYKSENKTVTEDFEVKFSVSHTYEPGTGDDEFGSCHQIMSYSMGMPEDVAEVYNKAGLAYIRDDINKNVCEFDGSKWVLKQSAVDGWKLLKDKGIKTIGILFGVKADTEGIPVTETQLAEWEEWVRDTVTRLNGIIDVYEVWNEPNYYAFNKNNATPEQYGELVKRTYKVIKDINPNLTVTGISTASVVYDWTKRVFETGAGKYLDAVTIHPYDWSGSFRDKLWIEDANSIHKLMEEYGIGDKEVWATEFGFSTYIGENGYTRQEQYQNHVLGRAIAKAYKIYDKYVFYCLADRARRDEVEENWGIVDWYLAENDPYAAKESFIAMTAFSYFINQNSEIKQSDGDESIYSFLFDNKELGKNVLLLQSNNHDVNTAGGVKRTYNLGCPSVDVYDAYGNLINTVYSKNGEYSFVLTAEPIYVTGGFSGFEITEYNAPIEANYTSISGAGGDTVELKFTKKTDASFKINVENTVEVLENDGFHGDTATVKIKVPNTLGSSYKFNVSVTDADGKTYYAVQHSLNVTSPLSISAVSEPASELNNNRWRVRATVKNLCVSQPVKGIYKVDAPADISSLNGQRAFELAPGEEVVYYINMPEKVNKNVINFKSTATLENGYCEENETTLNFTAAVYADKKPVIDGVIEKGEWLGSWIGADEADSVKEIADWGGPSDISFSGTLMWDEDNLYFLGIANDDVHYTSYGDDPFNMWSTDSFQIAIDDRADINPVGAGLINEFGIAQGSDGKASVYRYSSYYNTDNAGPVENCDVAVKRYDTYTVYEVRLPWDEIFYKDYEVDWQEKSHKYRFSALLNDNDGSGRGWIEYMSGIGTIKKVNLFGDLKLKK